MRKIPALNIETKYVENIVLIAAYYLAAYQKLGVHRLFFVVHSHHFVARNCIINYSLQYMLYLIQMDITAWGLV